MPNHPESSASAIDDDVIDLRLLLAKLWRSRKLIIGGTLLIAAAAIGINELSATYKSEGFLRVTGLNPVNYKRLQPVVLNVERFRAYAAEASVDEKLAKSIEGFLGSPEKFARAATLLYSTTAKDAKEYLNVSDTDKDRAAFLGLQIDTRGSSPQEAKDLNIRIADYFIDSLLITDLNEWVNSKVQDREQQSLSMNNQIIETTRKISDSERKIEALKLIVKRYPDAGRMDLRQVVSLDKGGERFMSPMAQIVANEASVVDWRQDVLTLQRKLKQIDIASAFYSRAAQSLTKTQSGKRLFTNLLSIQNEVFAKKGLTDEVTIETENLISMELESRRRTYFQDFRFISAPTMPDKEERKSRLLVLLSASIGGLIFMAIFSLFASWWGQSKSFVTTDHKEFEAIG